MPCIRITHPTMRGVNGSALSGPTWAKTAGQRQLLVVLLSPVIWVVQASILASSIQSECRAEVHLEPDQAAAAKDALDLCLYQVTHHLARAIQKVVVVAGPEAYPCWSDFAAAFAERGGVIEACAAGMPAVRIAEGTICCAVLQLYCNSLFLTVLCCAVLCCAVLCCAVPCRAVPCHDTQVYCHICCCTVMAHAAILACQMLRCKAHSCQQTAASLKLLHIQVSLAPQASTCS